MTNMSEAEMDRQYKEYLAWEMLIFTMSINQPLTPE